MAEQIIDKLMYPGGYIDEIMSVENFDALSGISRGDKFIGLTVTVKNALKNSENKSIPVDVWLSESKSGWVIKDIPPVDNVDILSTIPSSYIPSGFKVLLKNGETHSFVGLNENNEPEWFRDVDRNEFEDTISDAVEIAIDNITSGASEAFDTLKEIEEWIKNNSGKTQDLSDLYASAHTHDNKDVLDTITLAKINEWDSLESKIPSIDGLASEVYVKNAIAEAKLSGNTNIDLTGYATKDDIKDLASKDEIKTYTEGASIYIDNENKISVKIAADTEEKNNFIEINENNELELNTITLDAAVISEDIEVNGGAWADEVESVFDGKIPAGITFEDFLKKMLKREKFVNDFYTDRTFNVYAKEINPGLFYADKDVNNQIVEIGTKVTVKQFEPTSTKAEQSLTAGTFTYGYKVGEGGEYNSSQIYEEKITPNLISSGSILQVLSTNLTEDIEGTKPLENIYVNKANGDVMTIDTINAYVNKGYNSIKICQTGDTYAANTNIKGNNIYVATSLKKYQNSNGEDNIYNITFPESEITATNQVVYQVTGASKYYIGGINEYSNDYWNSNRSNEIINLEKSGWAIEDEIEVPYTFKVNTKQQTVAVPSEYTKVFGRDRLSGPVEFNLVKGSMNFYNSQGHVSKYNVFVAPVIDGLSVDSFITITMSKK